MVVDSNKIIEKLLHQISNLILENAILKTKLENNDEDVDKED